MQIGYFQFSPVFGDPDSNRETLVSAISGVQADLIVLPELATSGYNFVDPQEVQRTAETLPGPTTEALQAEARRRNGFTVIGLPEQTEEGIYNSAALIGPQGLIGVYRKMHLFSREKEFFLPGNLGFPVFEAAGVSIGLLVCFDHIFPEAARTLALAGARIICHPSNLVLTGLGQLTTRVRALENRVFWILANRIGSEDRQGSRLTYTGCSQIVDPRGEVLDQSSEGEEQLCLTTVSVAEAADKHVTARNDLFSDRRPGDYRL